MKLGLEISQLRRLACALSWLGLTACSYKTVLVAPVVSMYSSPPPSNKNRAPARPLTIELCEEVAGNECATFHRAQGGVGLVDRVICKAQHESNARYLRDVTISTSGSGGCVTLEAVAIP